MNLIPINNCESGKCCTTGLCLVTCRTLSRLGLRLMLKFHRTSIAFFSPRSPTLKIYSFKDVLISVYKKLVLSPGNLGFLFFSSVFVSSLSL